MATIKLDLTGLRCPIPALKTRKALKPLQAGDVVNFAMEFERALIIALATDDGGKNREGRGFRRLGGARHGEGAATVAVRAPRHRASATVNRALGVFELTRFTQ